MTSLQFRATWHGIRNRDPGGFIAIQPEGIAIPLLRQPIRNIRLTEDFKDDWPESVVRKTFGVFCRILEQRGYRVGGCPAGWWIKARLTC
jgi:hypothetical protein